MSIANYSSEPDEITVGATVVIIRDGISEVQVPLEEEGQTQTMWQCDEVRLSPAEFEDLKRGAWKGGWTPATHKAFRQHQHDRTLGLYDLARRKAKSNPAWEAYIAELDSWNDQVSALAADYAVAVPELPAQPSNGRRGDRDQDILDG